MHLRESLDTFNSSFYKILNTRDKEKIKKYSDALGGGILSRFSPIVFESDGCISSVTKELLESKFLRFPQLHSKLKDNYDKSLKWFYKMNSMNVARTNYAIFREYVHQNAGKY